MLVLIRGAGDIATGIGLRLWRSGFHVVMTDLPQPTSIRRTVCFSEALIRGSWQVEEATAVRETTPAHAAADILNGVIPVLADPNLRCLDTIKPDILVDAILAKRNIGTTQDMAPVVIAVGPGFTAGEDCHAVVETMRGHTLGRVYYHGSALPNTNIPGYIGGFSGERVLRAPADGVFHSTHQIGDKVTEGEAVGYVGDAPMCCTISGVLRGLLPDNTPVFKNMKSGDVDPRGDRSYCYQVSDKALAVGGGVLEAALKLSNVLNCKTIR